LPGQMASLPSIKIESTHKPLFSLPHHTRISSHHFCHPSSPLPPLPPLIRMDKGGHCPWYCCWLPSSSLLLLPLLLSFVQSPHQLPATLVAIAIPLATPTLALFVAVAIALATVSIALFVSCRHSHRCQTSSHPCPCPCTLCHCRPLLLPLLTLPSLTIAIALFVVIAITLQPLPLPTLLPSSSLLPLLPLPSLSPATPRCCHHRACHCCCHCCHPRRRSHCFFCHCPCNRHLIAVSKRWAMATAAAMAALTATALGDYGGGSSNEDGCCNSGGKDNGKGSNGIGDDCPLCCPRHTHFVNRHVVANAIAHVFAVAIAFASMR
jgi:hypothetical protein